jgi:hypothetical protein
METILAGNELTIGKLQEKENHIGLKINSLLM